MPLQERPVAGRAPSRMQGNQIERRGVRGAVIGRVRDQLEMRQFAVAHFVQYLAGLGIAVVVVFLCLQGAENLQCSARKLRIDEGVLQRDDQAVASERRDEPGKPGGRQENHMIRACHRQAERGHVLERLAKQAIKFLVAGPDLDNVFQPVRQSSRRGATCGCARCSRSAKQNAGRRLPGYREGSNAMARPV